MALCRFGSSRQFLTTLSELPRVFYFGSSLPRRSRTHLVDSMDLSFHSFSGFAFEQHPHPSRVSFPDRFLHGVHRHLDLPRDASRARLHAWKAHHTCACGHRRRRRRRLQNRLRRPPSSRLIRTPYRSDRIRFVSKNREDEIREDRKGSTRVGSVEGTRIEWNRSSTASVQVEGKSKE